MTAIASAHGVTDVDAFKQHITAHLTVSEPRRPGRPVQLALFDTALAS